MFLLMYRILSGMIWTSNVNGISFSRKMAGLAKRFIFAISKTKMLIILKVNGRTYMYYFRSLRNQRLNDKNVMQDVSEGKENT